jgi:hypothetical protein
VKVCKLVVQAPEAGLLAPDLVLYLDILLRLLHREEAMVVSTMNKLSFRRRLNSISNLCRTHPGR